jgi:hypothetical protein
MRDRLTYLLLPLCTLLLWMSCAKEEPAPHNPYDDIVYPTPPSPVDTLSPTSFVSLHKRIFAVSCAKANCHDGNFEPDFRTPESAFATLVYHPIIKNNVAETFKYRVIPFDTANSVLHERLTNCCFVNVNDRMPQDQVGVPLAQDKINDITTWIAEGARDMFGKVAAYPNAEPFIEYFLIGDSAYTTLLSGQENRIDSVYYNPVVLTSNTAVHILIKVTDDSTSVANITGKLKMSLDKDDFSSGAPGYREYNTTYINGGSNDEYQKTDVNTGDFPSSQVIYMRYFVNDGDHAADLFFPKNESILPYKTYWSFYVLP